MDHNEFNQKLIDCKVWERFLKVEERIGYIEADIKRLQSVEEENESLTDEVSRLKDIEIERLTKENQDFKERIKDLDAEKEHLTDQVSKLESDKGMLDVQIDALTVEKKKLEEQVLDLESNKKNLETQVDDLDETKKRLGEQVSKLESDKRTLKEHICTLSEERDKQKGQLSELESEKKTLETQVSTLTVEKKKLGEQLSELESNKKNLETQVDDLDEEKKGLEEQVSKLESDNKRIGVQIETLEEEKKKLEDVSKKYTESWNEFVKDYKELLVLMYQCSALQDVIKVFGMDVSKNGDDFQSIICFVSMLGSQDTFAPLLYNFYESVNSKSESRHPLDEDDYRFIDALNRYYRKMYGMKYDKFWYPQNGETKYDKEKMRDIDLSTKACQSFSEIYVPAVMRDSEHVEKMMKVKGE